ncbi:hypothetical protein Q3G72_034521 [Acer saccharum]|nr:hypothetical protein Q3G72_034521 [Acer saccharum]
MIADGVSALFFLVRCCYGLFLFAQFRVYGCLVGGLLFVVLGLVCIFKSGSQIMLSRPGHNGGVRGSRFHALLVLPLLRLYHVSLIDSVHDVFQEAEVTHVGGSPET